MPTLDYALLCDYVRQEGGIAHIVAANIDTVRADGVPTGANFGLVVRLLFSEEELAREHSFAVVFRREGGSELARIEGGLEPLGHKEQLPAGWQHARLITMNLGVPLPQYGLYSLDVLLGTGVLATLNLRVVRAEET